MKPTAVSDNGAVLLSRDNFMSQWLCYGMDICMSH